MQDPVLTTIGLGPDRRLVHTRGLPRKLYLCVLRTAWHWLPDPWPELKKRDLIVYCCLNVDGRKSGEWFARSCVSLVSAATDAHDGAIVGQPAYFVRALPRSDGEAYFADILYAGNRFDPEA